MGTTQYARAKQDSVLSGMVWMFVISILLFWLPVLGGLIAGFVGGRKAGSLGRAILAVFLPGIIFFVAIFVLAASLIGIPLIGVAAGLGGLWLSVLHVGPLLVGAIIGGATA
ncbi:MAG: hypothetical protein ROO76_23910 [Terriglobia bacterium]|nr:hypothetical protein [Terriglobia bacterium]